MKHIVFFGKSNEPITFPCYQENQLKIAQNYRKKLTKHYQDNDVETDEETLKAGIRFCFEELKRKLYKKEVDIKCDLWTYKP